MTCARQTMRRNCWWQTHSCPRTLPQFNFHVNTAYVILRNHGVELGKADYVSHMFKYIRPEAMPKG
uniref:DUF1993 family protein n=1 Tax=Cupriavidus ulmosensis TaxID=3065913 RepID=UPI003F83B4BB